MKNIEEYTKSANIYLIPNVRSGNSLKVEFGGFFDISVFENVLTKLRKLGFNCSTEVSSSSIMGQPNIIDIALRLWVDEREVASDLFIYLETVLGKDEVINRVTTKAKTK